MFILAIKCKKLIPFLPSLEREGVQYSTNIHIYLERKSQYYHWNPETGDWQDDMYYNIDKIRNQIQ